MQNVAGTNTSIKSAGEPSMLDPVYGYRDDLAEHYKPASAYERLLLGVAAQALKRFHDAQTLERRLFEKVDPLELLTNSPDTFKTVTRHVADCERAWRKSLEEIRRAIRQRETGPTVRKPYPRPTAPPPQSAAPPNIPVPPPAPVQSRRE